MKPLILFVFLIFILWLVGFFIVNDFSIPTVKIKSKKILVIFPHPDDEAHTISGLSNLNLLILTKGEAGEGGPDVKNIRTQEMKDSAAILGANLIQADFGDGQIKSKIDEVAKYVDSQISEIKPDLIITYDLAGLYGHEDHIATSEIVTNLVKEKYPEISLWYTSLPPKVLKLTNLPTQMAKDPNFSARRSIPNLKVFIGINVLKTIRAVYTHKTQYQSFRSTVPKILPLWFVYSMQQYEYFSKAN